MRPYMFLRKRNRKSQRFWQILNLLRTNGPMTAEDLAYNLGIGRSIYKYLKELLRRGDIEEIPPQPRKFRIKGAEIKKSEPKQVKPLQSQSSSKQVEIDVPNSDLESRIEELEKQVEEIEDKIEFIETKLVGDILLRLNDLLEGGGESGQKNL